MNISTIKNKWEHTSEYNPILDPFNGLGPAFKLRLGSARGGSLVSAPPGWAIKAYISIASSTHPGSKAKSKIRNPILTGSVCGEAHEPNASSEKWRITHVGIESLVTCDGTQYRNCVILAYGAVINHPSHSWLQAHTSVEGTGDSYRASTI